MGVTKKSTVKLGVAGIVGIAVVMLFMVMFAVERIDSGRRVSLLIWQAANVVWTMLK